MDQKSVVFQISGTVNPVNMDTEGAIKVSVLTGFPLSLPQRGGEGRLGRKKKRARAHRTPRAFHFFDYCYFYIGIPSGSLWGGGRGSRIKRIKFRGNVMAFFPSGTKQTVRHYEVSVSYGCP